MSWFESANSGYTPNPTGKTDNKILLSSTEAAGLLGLSKTTLHRHVKSGKLECIRLAENSIYFTQQQLDEFINRHRKRYTPQHPNAGVI